MFDLGLGIHGLLGQIDFGPTNGPKSTSNQVEIK